MERARWLTMVVATLVCSCTSDQIFELVTDLPSEDRVTISASEEPPRYADVAPIFVAQCDRCHNASISDNKKAQAVFESSSYPFATKRPDSLLRNLRHMFEVRQSLTEEQRRLGLEWIDAGALDDSGRRPPWAPPSDEVLESH